MENDQTLSPNRLQDGEVNLSSWTVTFKRAIMGAWTWEAIGPDGATAGPLLPPGMFAKKEKAEADAVSTLTRIETGADREEISAFDLQIRVRERGRTQT
jgi:hypothetical protein